jgi:phosphonate transport system substrate-binding protein
MIKGPLKLASLMSENENFMFEAIARYIQEHLEIPVQIIDRIPWREREQLLDAGQIDIAWICGLPYILRADRPDSAIALLAAPVISRPRYRNNPIYFSDVVVHRDSQFQTFANLRGAIWAYNEPNSHSGYNVVRYHLAALGEREKYFGKVIESGSHLSSIQMVLRREVDASAIDSIVLEIEFQHHPDLGRELKIIETLGPSPIPPLVVSRKLPLQFREILKDSLIKMDTNSPGQAVLTKGQMIRLALVQDPDYDAIRQMQQKGRDIILQPSPK